MAESVGCAVTGRLFAFCIITKLYVKGINKASQIFLRKSSDIVPTKCIVNVFEQFLQQRGTINGINRPNVKENANVRCNLIK
jgi:hypothetical protein